ncbi:hypothetical protein HDV63DRAFT_43690 [Trichoderma sp. SZMC 28014]
MRRRCTLGNVYANQRAAQRSAASLVQQLRHHGRSTGELSANGHASIITGSPFGSCNEPFCWGERGQVLLISIACLHYAGSPLAVMKAVWAWLLSKLLSQVSTGYFCQFLCPFFYHFLGEAPVWRLLIDVWGLSWKKRRQKPYVFCWIISGMLRYYQMSFTDLRFQIGLSQSMLLRALGFKGGHSVGLQCRAGHGNKLQLVDS